MVLCCRRWWSEQVPAMAPPSPSKGKEGAPALDYAPAAHQPATTKKPASFLSNFKLPVGRSKPSSPSAAAAAAAVPVAAASPLPPQASTSDDQSSSAASAADPPSPSLVSPSRAHPPTDGGGGGAAVVLPSSSSPSSSASAAASAAAAAALSFSSSSSSSSSSPSSDLTFVPYVRPVVPSRHSSLSSKRSYASSLSLYDELVGLSSEESYQRSLHDKERCGVKLLKACTDGQGKGRMFPDERIRLVARAISELELAVKNEARVYEHHHDDKSESSSSSSSSATTTTTAIIARVLDVDLYRASRGRTALHLAVLTLRGESPLVQVCETLIRAGAKPGVRDHSGRNAMDMLVDRDDGQRRPNHEEWREWTDGREDVVNVDGGGGDDKDYGDEDKGGGDGKEGGEDDGDGKGKAGSSAAPAAECKRRLRGGFNVWTAEKAERALDDKIMRKSKSKDKDKIKGAAKTSNSGGGSGSGSSAKVSATPSSLPSGSASSPPRRPPPRPPLPSTSTSSPVSPPCSCRPIPPSQFAWSAVSETTASAPVPRRRCLPRLRRPTDLQSRGNRRGKA